MEDEDDVECLRLVLSSSSDEEDDNVMMKDAYERADISVEILETVTVDVERTLAVGLNKMAELEHQLTSQSVEQVVTATADNRNVFEDVDEESFGVKQCRVLLRKLKADSYEERTRDDGPGVEQMTGVKSDKMGSGMRTTIRGLGQLGEKKVNVSKDDEPMDSNKLAPLARDRLSGLVTHLSGRVGRKGGERKTGVNKLTLGGKRKTFPSVTDTESESSIARSNESKYCVAEFAQEILAKLEGVKTDELKLEQLETNLDVKADSGEVCETDPLRCGRISVADSKLLFKESLSLQSYSISSSGLGVGWEDSDSDDDVVILEESFAGTIPGLEFQAPGVSTSVTSYVHHDLFKIFDSQDNIGDITAKRKSIDVKEEGVVKMCQPIIDDPNIKETIECKKSILIVEEFVFDERSKSSISKSYESQMKVGDQNAGIANVSTPNKTKICDGNGWFQPKLNEKKLAKDSADVKEAWKVKDVVANEKYKPSVKDVYKENKRSPYKNIEQEAVHKLSIGDVLKTSFSFKIPKTKCKKDPGKVAKVTELGDRKTDIVSLHGQSLSIKTFLEQEEIVPEVRLESSYEGVGRDQFDTMYERVISIKNTTKKNIPEVDDDVEKEDIENEEWDALKKMQTDAERNSWVQAQFENTIPSDPGRNLTVHGFRRQTGQNTSANLSVQTDQVLPSGVKRNIRDDDESEVEPKKIKLSDFGSFMKSVFFMKFNKNIGSRKVLTSDLEAFKTYLGHFKGGLEETSNFLSYYNPRKELDEVQVEEVVDLENQFSTFRNYYGEAEDLFCKQCEKRHKFCQ